MNQQPSSTDDVRAIAFYLPQFHPIPENDAWWGKGFTEWTNVTRARPNFAGHYQPHMPADLGFYDLRLSEVRQQQAQLARAYGIHGFCYYYYWFGGKKLLERPLEEMVATGEPDFPFCICWANGNWTRRWDGLDQEVLITQHYSDEDYRQMIRELMKVLLDRRYIRVNGKPLLVVHRAAELPDARRMTDVWRQECQMRGLGEIYLCAIRSFGVDDPVILGFDGGVEFPPSGGDLLNINSQFSLLNPQYTGYILSYAEYAAQRSVMPEVKFPLFGCVMPAWDNTARMQDKSWIFQGATPELYQQWLGRITQQTLKRHQGDERLLFINAWNEWAEGAHLEPDQRFGHRYLAATHDGLRMLPPVPTTGIMNTSAQLNEGSWRDPSTLLIEQLQTAQNISAELRQANAELRQALEARNEEVARLAANLDAIASSKTWRVAEIIWKLRRLLARGGRK